MQQYNYKTINYKDYTSRSSNSNSTGISSTSSTSKERTATDTASEEKMPINRKVIDEVRTLYHDAIGAYPSVLVCKEITQLLITGAITREELEYALTETAYAPRPSWAYAAAIIRRVQRDKQDVPF